MARRLPVLLVPWIGAVVAIRLLHYGSEPVMQEAATTARLAARMEASGWTPLDDQRLITDGSLTARRYRRGACILNLVVLPPDPDLIAVVATAWGGHASYMSDGVLQQAPPVPRSRLGLAWQGLRHRLGGPPPASAFSLAIAVEGDRARCLAGLDPGLGGK